MKKILFMAALVVMALATHAQNYAYTETVGTEFPYTLFEPNYMPLISSSSNVLSSWQTLPFPFTFYGTQVTGYYASDNGYITFDNTATVSISANDNPPTSGGPNNAIYTFWDAVEFVMGGSSCKSWTYGEAPHRVHVIQWSGTSREGATTNDYAYMGIRLYECGDFDVVHNLRGTPGFTGTVGCENANGTLATTVTGSPNLEFSDVIYLPDDDAVFHFYYNGQPTYDLMVEEIDNEKIITANDNLTGTIMNLGTTAITSFDIDYSVDNNTPVSNTISSVNISANGGTYQFSVPINLGSPGVIHTVDVWTSNLNGSNPDEKQCDDTLNVQLVEVEGISATKNVLIEEYTTAPCGYCPDGDYVIDTITANHSDVIAVAHHDGYLTDAMTTPGSTAYADKFAQGAPTATIDRVYRKGDPVVAIGRADWSSYIVNRLNEWTPCEVSLSVMYNSTTRVVDAILHADFVDYAIPGDLRHCLWIVEDSVVGNGSGYDQTNFYDNVVGHPYYQAGNPIIDYIHRHVHRKAAGTIWGVTGVIPTAPQKNDSFSKQYSATLPPIWDADKVSVVGYVAYWHPDERKRPILNAVEIKLSELVSLSENATDNTAPSLYPNPATTTAYVEFLIDEAQPVHLEITDLFGKVISIQDLGVRATGQHRVYIDATEFSEGVYLVNLQTGERTSTLKLSIVR